MKVLVIGGGGREHALAAAIRRSARVSEVVCAPGNGGIAAVAKCVRADQKDIDDLLRVVAAEKPDLTVVGPELPLSLGLVDALEQRGLRVFGPTREAALLETSKAHAKRFMQRHTIPTAAYAVCESQREALATLEMFHLPVVVKADGLAAGKGVLICEQKAEAEKAIAGLFGGQLLGEAQQSIVIEELLTGEELSFLVLSDGKHAVPLVPAQDHKRIGEGDTGPNTGGMGAYSTDAMLDAQMTEWILSHIAQKTVDGMAAEETPFQGRAVLRADDDGEGSDGAGVQRAVRRSGDAGDFAAHGERRGGGAGGVRGRAAERDGDSLETGRFGVRGGGVGRISGELHDGAADCGARTKRRGFRAWRFFMRGRRSMGSNIGRLAEGCWA